MKKLYLFALLFPLTWASVAAQKNADPKPTLSLPMTRLANFTLTGYHVEDGHGKLRQSEKADRNCFDFVSERETPCRSRWDIVYGSMRVGEEWDWFYIPASGMAQTRMVSLGKKNWSDIKSIPKVKPLPKLKPGQRRNASVDASGADGADGAPGQDGAAGRNGMNGDGSVSPQAPLEQERGMIESPSKSRSTGRVTTNEHFVKAVKGWMYILRVVDEEHDFYVLIRVDDVVRGRSATISWLRLLDM